MTRFILLAIVLAFGNLAFGQEISQLPAERIEIFDRGAQDRWQFDQDLIRARRDAMVDREIRFTEELQAEMRRRAIDRLLSNAMGDDRRGGLMLDRSRDAMLVQPISPRQTESRGCLLRRLLCGGGGDPQPQPLVLVPVLR